MISKTKTIKARETWLKCYEDLGSVSKAARKCGIPRSTLYRWIKRVQAEGKQGLEGKSKRPKTFAKQKVNPELVELIKSIISKNENSFVFTMFEGIKISLKRYGRYDGF